MNFFDLLALVVAAEAELAAVKAEIQAGQPAVVANPDGSPIKTYLFGKHVQFTINIAPAA